MFAGRPRFPLTAFSLFAPFALLACGDSPKPVTTSSVGATTPSVRTAPAAIPAGMPATAPVTITFADGETAYRAGRYEDAANRFAEYSERHPANAGAEYMLGLSAWKSGDLKGARAALDRSIALDPRNVKALLNSARVLLDLGKTDEALDRVNSVLAIDSTSAVARRLQGRALHGSGDAEGAIDAYLSALAIDERDVWSLNNLGLVYIEQGRNDEALLPLSRAVELQPRAPVFQNNLGIALERTGHIAQATEAFEAALESDSSYTRAAVSLARVQSRSDSRETGTIDLKELAQNFTLQIRMLRDSVTSVATDSAEVIPAPKVSDPVTPETDEK